MKQTKPSADIEAIQLVKIARKIDDSREFLKVLNNDQTKLYKSTVERLKVDTHYELTETEYENIATMQFFCDKFEQHFASTDASEIDPDLFNIYRMAKDKITDHLRFYREGSKKTSPSIKNIKEYLEKIELEDGTKITRGFKKEDSEIIEIIDIPEEKKE